jgi:alkylhydroperoxidase/carboxymuconolactone decarboxylase family protein YurZ
MTLHMICVMRRWGARTFNGIARSSAQDLPDHWRRACSRKEVLLLDYTELLRRLALQDEAVAHVLDGADTRSLELDPALDPRSLALVRLAALVAVGGAVPSYGALADAAVDAGATTAEIVDVLVGVISVVGLPCVVAAAPKLALALGHDVEDELGMLRRV